MLKILTSNTTVAIGVTSNVFICLGVLILAIISHDLNIWWQIGLIIIFGISVLTSLRVLIRLPDREKALECLDELISRNQLEYNSTYKVQKAYKYIKDNLR